MDETLVICVGSTVLAVVLIIAVIVYGEHKRKKREWHLKSIAEEREQYLNSIASDSDVIRTFDTFFPGWVSSTVKNEWQAVGKNPCKQNGDYRVDFTRAVQGKIQEYKLLGVTPDAVLQFIHAQGGNPTIRDLKDKVFNAADAIINMSQTRLSQGIFASGITPQDFFTLRAGKSGDSVGVYIIWNQTKNMYYVGQAKRLCFRVNQHFTGHGNGDVYADYKYGDQFLIKLITLRESGYDDLDKLERDMIMQYHANIDGYNKTSGNYGI